MTGGPLEAQVLRGIAWKVASQVILQGSRIVVALVLARLLAPHDYGIAGMVLVFSSLVAVFSDVVVQELPDRVQPARAVILGVLLIILMLVARGGVVGIYRTVQAKRLARKARRAAVPAAVATPDVGPADSP